MPGLGQMRTRLSCPQVVDLLSDWLEGDLDARTAAAVRAHLAGCPGCTAYVGQLRAAVGVLGALPPPLPDAALCEELVQAFRQWRPSPGARPPADP